MGELQNRLQAHGKQKQVNTTSLTERKTLKYCNSHSTMFYFFKKRNLELATILYTSSTGKERVTTRLSYTKIQRATCWNSAQHLHSRSGKTIKRTEVFCATKNWQRFLYHLIRGNKTNRSS
jgi:hypothetical protein